jgi:hypothetical protein
MGKRNQVIYAPPGFTTAHQLVLREPKGSYCWYWNGKAWSGKSPGKPYDSTASIVQAIAEAIKVKPIGTENYQLCQIRA